MDKRKNPDELFAYEGVIKCDYFFCLLKEMIIRKFHKVKQTINEISIKEFLLLFQHFAPNCFLNNLTKIIKRNIIYIKRQF